jgi:hypothetical protein
VPKARRKNDLPRKSGKPRRGTTARAVDQAEAAAFVPPPPYPRLAPGVAPGPGEPDLFDAEPSAELLPGEDSPFGIYVREAAFIKAYLGAAKGVAAEAARMVGLGHENPHSARVTGSRMLARGRVQRIIARELVRKLGGPKWVKAGLAEIANGNMADLIDSATGRVDPERVTAAAAWGVVESYQEESTEAVGGVVVTRRKVKLYSRLKALTTLARIHGLLIDRKQVEGTLDHRHTVRDAVARVLADPKAYRVARQLADLMGTPEGTRPVGAEQPPGGN